MPKPNVDVFALEDVFSCAQYMLMNVLDHTFGWRPCDKLTIEVMKMVEAEQYDNQYLTTEVSVN